MDFPLSIIEPCLERAQAIVALPEDAPDIVFSYATTDPAAAQAAAAGPRTLLVTAAKQARDLAQTDAASCPVLAIAPACDPAAAASGNASDLAGKRSPVRIAYASGALSPEAACDAINRYLVELREWNARMGDLILADCTCQDLIDMSEPVIGRYLALSDALFTRVAVTKNIPPLDDMSRALVETGSYPTSAIPRIEQIAKEQRWHSQDHSRLDQKGNEINPFPNIARVYRFERNYAAHLVMVSPQAITPQERFLFDILADRIGACLDHTWKTGDVSRDRGATFLTALLNGAFTGSGDLEERAHRFDLPLEGVFELGVISGAEERGGVTHFARQIKSALKGCQAVVIEQRIYVLLVSSGKGSGKIAAMEDTLFAMVSHLHAEMGLSSRFEQLSSCSMARMEADVALQYGAKNRSKYVALVNKDPFLSCVFRFNRYFPCYLVDPYADTAEFLSEYAKAPNLVNRLRKADAENGTDDFGLLKIYLYFDCSIKKTAELLGMHRNTVVYRLNKIRNDFFIDLDDCDTRLFLHYLFGVLE